MAKFLSINWISLFLLFILACGNPINIEIPEITSVSIVRNQLIVKGKNFFNIEALSLSDPTTGFNKSFEIAAMSETQIIGNNEDILQIPVPSLMNLLIDTAQGQTVIPVSFSLQNNAVSTATIQNNAVTSAKILNGGVTRLKLNKEPSDAPAEGDILAWDSGSQQFVFAPQTGGGGGGGSVSAITRGVGIANQGTIITTSGTISVDKSTTGDPTFTKIPFFNNSNQLEIANSADLLFSDTIANFSLLNNGGAFTIREGAANDFLIVDDLGNVDIQVALRVANQSVCLANGTGCPNSLSPISEITTTPPLTGGGTTGIVNISAGTLNTANNLVQLDGTAKLPAVDGSKLLNNVTKITTTTGLTVTNGGVGDVVLGLDMGSTGTAQPYSAALTDISNIPYAPANGVVITGNGSNFVGMSGNTFRSATGLAIGTDVQAQNTNLQQISNLAQAGSTFLTSNGTNYSLTNTPACGNNGFLVAGNGTSFNCSDTSFVFKLKETQYFETSAPFLNYVGFVAPADVLANTIWTLPAQDGANGTVLTTDGTGKLSWGTGNGDVKGPAASTNQEVAIFSGTTGKAITNSNILIGNIVSRTNTPVVAGHLPSYNGTVGNLIQDSGILATDVVTNTLPFSAANRVVIAAGTTKAVTQSGYTVPPSVCPSGQVLKSDGTNFICQADNNSGDVTGPINSITGNLSLFTDATGKVIGDSAIPSANVMTMGAASVIMGNILTTAGGKSAQDSGTSLSNIPTMAAGAAGPNTVVLSNAADKTLKTTIYTIPSTICSIGEVLKSNGTNFICQSDTDSVASVFGRSGTVIAQSGDYTATLVANTPAGTIAGTTVQAALNELDTEKLALAGGTMSGTLITSSQNGIQIGSAGANTGELRFVESAGTNYVGFKAPNSFLSNIIWTLPGADGTSGQLLSTDGSGILSWTTAGSGGLGNVVGPASAVSTNLASYNGTTGKLIQDSLIPSGDVMTMGTVALAAGNILTSAGTNKSAQDSGTALSNIPTMATGAPSSNTIILSAGVDKTQKSSVYTVPSTVCPNGQILKSDGTNFICQPIADGVTSFNTRAGAVVPVAGDYTATLVSNTPAGTVAGTTVQAALNELDTEKLALAGGTMSGAIITSSPVALQLGPSAASTGEVHFMELIGTGSNYVGFKAPDNIAGSNTIWTLPGADGASGAVLTTNGSKTLSWNLPSALGLGDVVGPGSSSDNALARFDSTTGKIIQNSTVLLDDTGNLTGVGNINTIPVSNFVTMTANATSADRVYLSNGVDKIAKTSPYIFPTSVGLSGQVLTSNGFGTVNWIDPATGNVTGPATSVLGRPAVFADGTGKVLTNTIPYTIPTINGTSGQALTTNGAGVTSWSAVGDVVGPGASTDLAVAKFSGAGGKTIQNSGVLISGTNGVSGITTLATTGNSTIGGTLGVTGITSLAATTIGATLGVTGATTLSSTLAVNGQTTFNNGGANSFTFPTSRGSTGQILKMNDAAGNLAWSSAAGDVVGPAGATDNALARYDLATGKLIQNSTVILDDTGNLTSVGSINGNPVSNFVTMTANAGGANTLYLSNGADKIAKTTLFTVPSAICPSGQVLKSDGVNYICSVTGSGDVAGPGASILNNLSSFADTTGKVLKDSGINSGNILTMTTGPTAGSQMVISTGLSKDLTTASYSVPSTLGLAGQVLTASATGAVWSSPASGSVPTDGGTPNLILTSSGTNNPLWANSLSNISFIDLNSNINAPAWKEGRMFYDRNNDAISYYNAQVGVTINLGQEMVFLARNNSGGIISNGSAVYVTGAQGNKPTIGLARADASSTSRVIGLTTQDISNNSDGYVTMTGLVNDLNTNSFNEGDLLYLSPIVAGGFTTTAPAPPNLSIICGRVISRSPTTGIVGVAPIVGSGNVVGPSSSVVNRPAIYSDTSGKLLTNTVPYTIPIVNGTSGQVLTTNGSGTTSWTTISGVGLGDVVGPASATADTPALFANATGKLIYGGSATYMDFQTNLSSTSLKSKASTTIPAWKEGRVFYNPDAKTMAYHTEKIGVSINLGQQLTFRVTNNSGTDITIGQAVYPTGTNGAQLMVALAQADTDEKANILGLAAQDIPDGEDGFVTAFGIIKNLNTNSFPDGTEIFLSATEPGGYTSIPPSIVTKIGRIVKSDLTTGVLSVIPDVRGLAAYGPLGSVANRPALYSDSTGKKLKEASYTLPLTSGSVGTVLGITGAGTADWVTAGAGNVIGPSTNASSTLAQWSGVNSKTLTQTSYTFPTTVGTNGQVLGSDGTNVIWQTVSGGSGDVVGPILPTIANRAAVFADATGKLLAEAPYTLPMTQGTIGQVLTVNGVGTTVWGNLGSGSGDIIGPPSSTLNRPALFADASGKLLKEAGYALPATVGAGGEILISDGSNVIFAPDNSIKLSGTFSNAKNNVAIFSTPDAELIEDSGISIFSLAQFIATPTGANYPMVTAQAGDMEVKPASYMIPPTVCPSGQSLVSDGTDFVCANGSIIIDWKPSTAYNVGDKILYNNNNFALCLTAHISGTKISEHWSNWEFFSMQDVGTGIYSWTSPFITAGTNSNTFKVMAGTGLIVTSSVGLNQNFTVVEWPTVDNITPSGINTPGETIVFIDLAGQIVQQTTTSNSDIQNKIRLGVVFHNQPGVIDYITPSTTVGMNTNLQFNSFLQNMGAFKTQIPNNIIYSTTANLTLNRSAGVLNWLGTNPANLMAPNTFPISAQSPVIFEYYNRNGFISSQNTLNPTLYDNNGTLSSVGNNNWTIQRLFLFPSGNTGVLYDQERYATVQLAQQNLEKENVTLPPELKSGVFYIGKFILRGNATVSSDTANNVLYNCGKFGCGTGGGGGGSSGGDVLGPAFSNINRLAIFADGSGKVLAESTFAPPSTEGSSGQVLTSNGDGTTKWGTISPAPTRASLPSDRKLKKEIKDLTESYIDKIMDLRPVSFLWKDTLHRDIGFIAQEVKKVFPNLVEEDAGYMGVNYQKMVVPLIKAFQEQQVEIKKYQEIISRLEERLDKLEQKSSN